MIDVKGLYYSYSNDENYAVKDVSFHVENGEIFGFLGPSGAGKSTTQNILTGLLPLQKGEVNVSGYDLRKVDKTRFNKIGVSFEQSNVYSKLTALENLQYYAKLFDVPTRDPMELIRLVGLEGKEKQKAGEFSKGMKHRLIFARSMLNDPDLWFLDEPTTGLDPAIAATIKDIIKRQNAHGVTCFLTTHNMYIAEELCHRVAFIIDGKIHLIDTPRNLKLKYGEKTVAVEFYEDGVQKQETLKPADEVERTRLKDILDHCEIITMHTKEASLEDIFISVTGRRLIGDESI